jgi:phosphopantetheine--protein transferase-like protein
MEPENPEGRHLSRTMEIAVGNDVVDLADPETRLEGLHPRFESRVFSDAERAALAASPSRHRLHWAFWAAKESAYKALKRVQPGLVFSPRELEVTLALPDGASGRAAGRVCRGNEGLDLEVRFDGDSVHAVACSRGTGAWRILSAVAETREDASLAVRRLATTALAAALDIEPGALRIVSRPPEVWSSDHPLEAVLSLSHHGRFVAFACALPCPETPPANLWRGASAF